MKKMMAMVVTVMMLGGCGIGELYKFAATKDPAACNAFEPGKTTQAQVEQMLGKPVGVAMTGDGKKAIYRAGYMTATVQYDQVGAVKTFECNKQ